MSWFEKKEEDNSKVVAAVIHLIMTIIIVVAVIAVVWMIGNMITAEQEPDVTNTFIGSRLESVSELTTAKLTYNGLIRYEDGEIPILTKKSFSMIYRAEVKAGIDFSEMNMEENIVITDTTVTITLPEVAILDVEVAEDSIEFYDEQSALFNWTEKEDTIDAIQAAENDVKEKADMEELKARAKSQPTVLLQELFQNVIGERELKIQYK